MQQKSAVRQRSGWERTGDARVCQQEIGGSLIAPELRNSAHLHRPWRATLSAATVSADPRRPAL